MMNWLRKLVGLGGTAKNLTSLDEEECKEEVNAFIEKSNLTLFEGNVQNLYSTQRIKETSVCPRCESETEKKAAIFVCATNTLTQLIISAENHFCTNCSSAVIDDKLLQNSCERGKVYRGIIGFFVRENIQTYQSLNEYIIRYHYDQNSKPSGIKITSDKINPYDPKIHASKGTKNQHKIPSSPVTLMDRVERRDKRESLSDSKFNRNSKDRSNQNEDAKPMTKEQKAKAARSERARIAMENVGKKTRNRSTKPKKKEEFADSVNETKQDFKDKVERKSNFNPKKRQKPVVENPNEKQTKQEKQEKQIEAKQEETKNLPPTKQAPPARASQRKKQTPVAAKKEEENVTNQESKQNVEAKQNNKTEVAESTSVDSGEQTAAPKKNRRYKKKNSTRKTRSNKRPIRKTVETEQSTPQNETKNELKNEVKSEQKNELKNEPKVENKADQNVEQSAKQSKEQTKRQPPKRQNARKSKEAKELKEINSEAQNETQQSNTNQTDKKQSEKQEPPKKDSVIEKLHQNLQESSKASIAPKEEKQKEQQKESSRLARLKNDTDEEKTSRRRPRTNVRPPIDLDLKNVTPRRRYNNTKKK